MIESNFSFLYFFVHCFVEQFLNNTLITIFATSFSFSFPSSFRSEEKKNIVAKIVFKSHTFLFHPKSFWYTYIFMFFNAFELKRKCVKKNIYLFLKPSPKVKILCKCWQKFSLFSYKQQKILYNRSTDSAPYNECLYHPFPSIQLK